MKAEAQTSPSRVLAKTDKHFGFLVKVLKVESHYALLQVFEIESTTDYDEPVETSPLINELSIKWDGCINAMFDNPVHFCGPRDMKAMALFWPQVYAFAYELMGIKPDIEWDEE